MKVPAWMREELTFTGPLAEGSDGKRVEVLQEWLTYHRCATAVDGEFGEATALSVRDFQRKLGLPVTGTVDKATFDALVAPMHAVLRPLPFAGGNFARTVIGYAQQHIAARPIEVGGQNTGPWVRLYMNGEDGTHRPWCAGFVTFMLHQAAEDHGHPSPIAGSVSCDSLAFQAKAAGKFVREAAVPSRRDALAEGCIFLVRHTDTDWTHTGLVAGFEGAAIRTLEGNTNDSGSREGFEAVARARGVRGKDYILLN